MAICELEIEVHVRKLYCTVEYAAKCKHYQNKKVLVRHGTHLTLSLLPLRVPCVHCVPCGWPWR